MQMTIPTTSHIYRHIHKLVKIVCLKKTVCAYRIVEKVIAKQNKIKISINQQQNTCEKETIKLKQYKKNFNTYTHVQK